MKLRQASFLTVIMVLGATFCASAGPEFVEEPSIPEGKALVYIYCPKGYFQAQRGIKATVLADDKQIAALQPGCYFAYLAEPGRIAFSAVERSTGVTMEVDAGGEYFVRIGTGMKRWEFSVVARERAIGEITSCRLPDPVAE